MLLEKRKGVRSEAPILLLSKYKWTYMYIYNTNYYHARFSKSFARRAWIICHKLLYVKSPTTKTMLTCLTCTFIARYLQKPFRIPCVLTFVAHPLQQTEPKTLGKKLEWAQKPHINIYATLICNCFYPPTLLTPKQNLKLLKKR